MPPLHRPSSFDPLIFLAQEEEEEEEEDKLLHLSSPTLSPIHIYISTAVLKYTCWRRYGCTWYPCDFLQVKVGLTSRKGILKVRSCSSFCVVLIYYQVPTSIYRTFNHYVYDKKHSFSYCSPPSLKKIIFINYRSKSREKNIDGDHMIPQRALAANDPI